MPLLDDGKEWDLFHGDCIPHLLRDMPEECVDFSIYSPPFPSVFSYTDSNADVGNVDAMDGEASVHLSFMFNGLYRVLKPGRAAIVHVAQIPRMKRSGGVGLCDFRGITLRLAERAGFIYEYDWSVRKNPQAQAIRTRSRELQFAGLESDRAAQRGTLQDYLIKIRKPGNNAVPIRDWDTVTNEYGDDAEVDKYSTQVSRNDWIKWAEGCWDDIQETDTLNTAAAKSEDDTRHICLAKGSLVLTRHDGYKPIEDVLLGDQVLTHNGRWMPVLAKEKTSESTDVVRVKAKGIHGVICTPTHKFWARKTTSNSHRIPAAKIRQPEWVEANDLSGCFINSKLPPVEETSLTEQQWWLIGRWIADGHFDQRDVAHISVGEDKHAHFEEMAGEYAGNPQFRTARQYPLKDPGRVIRSVLDRCGKLAHMKRLPCEAFTLDVKYATALLEGYMSGDGSIANGRCNYTASSASKELLLGIKILVHRVHNRVATIFEGRGPRQCVIQGRIVNAKQEWIISWGGKGHPHSFSADDGLWQPIKSVEVAGLAETWNIRVAEDASFMAEGCIVKNCPLQLEVIRRCILLFSNPGEIVFSPFAGIGSEGYVALGGKSPKTGKYLHDPRRFYGCELKDEYYEQAKKNLASACANRASAKAMSLFDEDEGL